ARRGNATACDAERYATCFRRAGAPTDARRFDGAGRNFSSVLVAVQGGGAAAKDRRTLSRRREPESARAQSLSARELVARRLWQAPGAPCRAPGEPRRAVDCRVRR